MTRNDMELMAELLDMASDHYTNHRCNDFRLPDTLENRAMYADMMLELNGEVVSIDSINGHGGFMCIQDWMLMEYFAAKLRREM